MLKTRVNKLEQDFHTLSEKVYRYYGTYWEIMEEIKKAIKSNDLDKIRVLTSLLSVIK